MERKLAAILAADVVGYATLMAANEEATLATLKNFQDRITAEVLTFHGRVFGGAGDSLIAEFSSPVEAVRCALALQRGIAKSNASLPQDRQMLFRIGVHLGDVMVEGDNLLGDGVNIAARLEALAPPEGILISRPVHDQVHQKVETEFASAGIHQLKNIATPVEVWAWPRNKAKNLFKKSLKARARLAGLPSLAAVAVTALALVFVWQFWGDERPNTTAVGAPRLAVLPFDDFSTGKDKGFLSDGVAEGLITELSRYRELNVIARNSSFQFRDRSLAIESIAHALRADYIIEGSKQKSGDKIRVTVQLIEGRDGTHIWAEKYDTDVGDVFEVQSNIVREIANRVGYELTRVPPRRSDRAAVGAFHYYLLGRAEFRKKELEATLRARDFFDKAIEADPEAPYGYVGMTLAIWRDLWNNEVDPETPRAEKLRQAETFADTALKLDPAYHYAHLVRADIHVAAGELEQAVLRYEAASHLNPNDVSVMVASTDALVFLGRSEEAITLLHKAIDLDPITPDWYFWQLGWANWSIGKCIEGLDAMHKMSTVPPNAQRVIAVLHVCNSDVTAGRDAITTFRAAKPERTLSDEYEAFSSSWRDPETMQRWIRELRAAGLPE